METRLTPMVGAPVVTPARVDTAPVRTAVKTDLAAPKAVTAQAGADQVRTSRDRRDDGSSVAKQTVSSFDLDRETGELVYKVIDEDTQSVLAQYPYEGLLKLRPISGPTSTKSKVSRHVPRSKDRRPGRPCRKTWLPGSFLLRLPNLTKP